MMLCIALFIFSYIFQRFFTDLDEFFISEILRNEALRVIMDPFWLIMFWPTVAIFFLSILVYFVFANKRATALAVLAIVGIGGLFLGDTLKSIFLLERPPGSFSDWVPVIYEGFIPLPGESHDFPAQSVLVPAALSVFFYLRDPKRWKALFFIIYTGLMFLARPYIGVNHISASLAGTVLGIYIGYLSLKYTEEIRKLSIFNSIPKRLLISIGFFTLMFLIYTLERPLFYSEPSRGVDLDIRMFMIVLGGFIGISVDGPKELRFQKDTFLQKIKFIGSIIIGYLILFSIYILALLIPTDLLFIGIILGFIDGLWISIGGPKLIEIINTPIQHNT